MLTIILPDQSTKTFPEQTTIRQVAQSIGKRLAEAAVAGVVNGQILDLDRPLPESSDPIQLRILTEKDKEALDVLRHSSAHVMARAVMRLFPNVQLAFGPTIENGFYYDILSDPPIREEDFPRIEEEMGKIIAASEPFERFELPKSEACQLCDDLKQSLKVEHIQEGLKEHATLSFYRQGEFVDLCRGPHIPHAGQIGAWKVLSIAGAYWKNDANRQQLQRLYGTAFFSKKDLDAYLSQVEEAKKRDHRLLGKQLRLFSISQAAGSGLILWMPKGAMIRSLLENFIRDELVKRGYSPVYTPHIGRLDLYRTSGHFPYYRDAQYPPLFLHPLGQTVDTWLNALEAGTLTSSQEKAFLDLVREMKVDLGGYASAQDQESKRAILRAWLENQEGYLVKPMNCPHHVQIYKATQHSYRDLPIRLAEFGTVYRFEQTGELSGMTRVRGFTQDDAHLFVTPEQVEPEFVNNLDLVVLVLKSLGLEDYRVRVSLRDPESDKYIGSMDNWKRAEEILTHTVKNVGMKHSLEKGEAAFYGPKVDFVVRDCIGREWQLGTVQLDYNLPERFGLEYIGADNQPHRPVMIHRAPFGSMERFIGILIEHFAGAFPLWLAPEQVRVMPVSEKFVEYAKKVEGELKTAGFRVQGDYRPEKIGYKIREAQLEKIPYMLVVGDREASQGTVAVRDRVEGDLGAMPVAELIAKLRQEVVDKRIRSTSSATVSFDDKGARFAD